MTRQGWAVVFTAYIIGLLSTGILRFELKTLSFPLWLSLALGWMVLGMILGFIIPKFWGKSPPWRVWMVAGLTAAVGVFYLYVRIPQPTTQDISQFVPQLPEEVIVTGTILNSPSLNRQQRIRFILQVQQVADNAEIGGKLYVTIPSDQGKNLVSRQRVQLIGNLYLPQPQKNPGGFDFREYLHNEGVFAGFYGQLAAQPTEKPLGGWVLRQRVLEAHQRGLGSPAGELVSGMVMGRRVVNLPYTLQDQFIQAGLAHTLAASGFHVSLLLGVVMGITQRLRTRQRVGVGVGVLLVYLSLTGLQPSVLRASLMGVAALLALLVERRVRPLGLLLVIATGLLLVNPLWVASLSFQMSFGVTFGLVVTVPAMMKRLDWLPPTIAGLLAIPWAASLWTLPLLWLNFNVLATYSIAVNALLMPLVSLVSLGGMVSGMVGVVWVWGGSLIARLFYYPTQFVIQMVSLMVQLPGSALAVGSLHLVQVLSLYGLFLLVWRVSSYGWVLGGVAVVLAIAPILYNNATLTQITVLATAGRPIVIVQDQGKVTLINAGDGDTANYTVIPFLASQAINRLALAIALTGENARQTGWTEISDNFAIPTLLHTARSPEAAFKTPKIGEVQPFPVNQTATLGELQVTSLGGNGGGLQLQLQGKTWGVVTGEGWEFPQTGDVLVFAGETLPKGEMKMKIAIAVSPTLSPETQQTLTQHNIQTYITGQHGAIQWTPDGGFRTMLKESRR
ncbi:ComEC/Rec2 family competence protein [Spirulina sp. CS-785/01]|uniref:ComEC/Rec2 family competence protein n=1 Tax=Spirulina sp. CS-785/01 TaxID=3021716 RepID=UPI00232B4440|nr:ComEC/Rec2 family competence protein [Spirulina sp. CS-785/01]MDB9312499.1 ComEC/Rec2 family competence protein [Spirulina sp. CS-785/01]